MQIRRPPNPGLWSRLRIRVRRRPRSALAALAAAAGALAAAVPDSHALRGLEPAA